MTKSNVMHRFARANAFVSVAVIASAALLPAILLSGSASAAQLQNRYVDLSSYHTSGVNSSGGSGRDGGDAAGQNVTYTVGFDIPVTGNMGAVAIEFCGDPDGVGGSPMTGPILLDACSTPQGFDASGAAIANQNGLTGLSVNGLTDTNLVVVSKVTPSSVTSNTADTTTIDGVSYPVSDVKFDITGIDNPSDLGTFYARITTYADEADLPTTTWVSTAEGTADNSIGTVLDDGGIALAIANELTVSARVQEVLQFCVGTTDAGTNSDCTDISGTAINLGVVDSSSAQVSDLDEGLAMIRTNAFNGAVIYYKAEQNTSSGKLKVAGATCNGVVTTDQCFNSSGTTQNSMVVGTEEFGMTATNVNNSNSGVPTSNLSRHADYDGDGTIGVGYAWDDSGSFDTIASSTTVIDDEMLELAFAATASPTTPTGLYTVTANFVATSTF